MSGGIAATLGMLSPTVEGMIQVAGVAALGGGLGSIIAKRIQITDLPQLVAAFHSLVGLAAVLTCVGTYMHDFPTLADNPSANVLLTSVLLGTYIGGVTFSGSLVAYGKLQGFLSSTPLLLPGRHYLNAGLLAANAAAMAAFYTDPSLSGGLAILGNFSLFHHIFSYVLTQISLNMCG